jgi:hypothetical protein
MKQAWKKLGLGLALTAILSLPLAAQEFTQGFGTDQDLLKGEVVARVEGDETKVEKANQHSGDRLYGAVVRAAETPVSLTDDTAGVLVATAGRFEVLISNLNGEIKTGDYLTASPIAGIAMKADDRQVKTIGQALQDFNTADPGQVLALRDVTTQDGTTKKAAMGRILVDLDVRNNPLAFGIFAPQVLIELGENIAGGPVSVTRIWGALAVILLSFITGSVIFYAGVRTSLIAIGRNPLSKGSVLRGFFQVTAISITIFLVGGFAVYLILKL